MVDCWHWHPAAQQGSPRSAQPAQICSCTHSTKLGTSVLLVEGICTAACRSDKARGRAGGSVSSRRGRQGQGTAGGDGGKSGGGRRGSGGGRGARPGPAARSPRQSHLHGACNQGGGRAAAPRIVHYARCCKMWAWGRHQRPCRAPSGSHSPCAIARQHSAAARTREAAITAAARRLAQARRLPTPPQSK